MKIKAPKTIYVPTQRGDKTITRPYRLRVRYEPENETSDRYIWYMFYVHGLSALITISGPSLSGVEREMLDFIRDSGYEYE